MVSDMTLCVFMCDMPGSYEESLCSPWLLCREILQNATASYIVLYMSAAVLMLGSLFLTPSWTQVCSTSIDHILSGILLFCPRCACYFLFYCLS